MEPLFSSALTLTEFFNHFQFGNQLGEGYPPPFNDYAQFLVYVRLPQSHPTLSEAEYRQYQNELKIKTIKELKAYWSYTREDAFIRAIADHLKVRFDLCTSIHYVRDENSGERHTPRINIYVPNRRVCWSLLTKEVPVATESSYTFVDVTTLTPQVFENLVGAYFASIPLREAASLSYQIARRRYKDWCAKAHLYELTVIDKLEPKEMKPSCPSIT